MSRYRLSQPAKADLASVLRSSETNHGTDARVRYLGLLTAAMRRIAKDPHGLLTKDRGNIAPGLRSLHIRHSRSESHTAPVGDPAHVIFYRAVKPDAVEIVRVLHERMEPSRHLVADDHDPKKS